MSRILYASIAATAALSSGCGASQHMTAQALDRQVAQARRFNGFFRIFPERGRAVHCNVHLSNGPIPTPGTNPNAIVGATCTTRVEVVRSARTNTTRVLFLERWRYKDRQPKRWHHGGWVVTVNARRATLTKAFRDTPQLW
ncbi:MAG TPA: hypothetical protein VKR79_11190 [Gaiellaceae bacterium]|nr:hypothetical protein [Gaiellaceae bacterium]